MFLGNKSKRATASKECPRQNDNETKYGQVRTQHLYKGKFWFSLSFLNEIFSPLDNWQKHDQMYKKSMIKCIRSLIDDRQIWLIWNEYNKNLSMKETMQGVESLKYKKEENFVDFYQSQVTYDG